MQRELATITTEEALSNLRYHITRAIVQFETIDRNAHHSQLHDPQLLLDIALGLRHLHIRGFHFNQQHQLHRRYYRPPTLSRAPTNSQPANLQARPERAESPINIV